MIETILLKCYYYNIINALSSLTHSLTQRRIRSLGTFRSAGHLKILVHIGLGILNIGVILHSWETADRMKSGYSLNYRPKRSENTPGWHHTLSHHRLRDVQFNWRLLGQFWNIVFLIFFSLFPTDPNEEFLNNIKKYWKICIISQGIPIV